MMKERRNEIVLKEDPSFQGRHFTEKEISFIKSSCFTEKELDWFMKKRNIMPIEKIRIKEELGIKILKPIDWSLISTSKGGL